MRQVVAALCALAAVMVATPSGQAHPTFAGTWDINAALSANLRDDERAGTTLVINQTDRELVIERTVAGNTRVITYALDGNLATSRAGNIEIRSHSHWDGARLITEGTQKTSIVLIPIAVEFTETRSLSEDGQTMTVETALRRGGETTRRKAVFHRRTPAGR